MFHNSKIVLNKWSYLDKKQKIGAFMQSISLNYEQSPLIQIQYLLFRDL